MPNKKLSEYQVKKLFSEFNSIPFYGDYINSSKQITNEHLKDEMLVAKIDNGTKGRFKNGLVKLNATDQEVYDWVKTKDTSANFYVEKFESVSKEYYVCIRVEDDYDVIYINDEGGVNNMNPLENATKIKIKVDSGDFHNDFVIKELPIELCLSIEKLYKFFNHFHFTFLEVNPLALTESGAYKPIDFAVFIDESSLYLFPEYNNILEMEYNKISFNHPTEEFISKLDAKTGSSLKFSMLNENGKVWTLISGGGASVLFTDAIVNRGHGSELANYGEMSGDPPSEYVYLYVSEVLNCMKKIEGEKVLFIGGAIANFTDVYESFKGIVKAFSENLSLFDSTKVYVRRGGPKSKEALDHLQEFSDTHNLNFKIYNTKKGVTEIVNDALEYKPCEKSSQMSNLDYSHLKNFEIQTNSPGVLNISQFMIYSYNPKAIQRMLDYDYISNRPEPSIACIVDVRKSKDSFEKFFWGENTILLPLYNKLDETVLSKHNAVNSVVSFASHRSAYTSSLDILELEQITSLTIIAEGIPERYARLLQLKAQEKNKTIIGPATVGGIKPGSYRIGNTCGTIENITNLNLHKPGSIGFVSRSGGMLNEMCNVIANCTNGVHQAISIGGDRYPSSSFMHHILNYQNDPNVHIIVMLGEIGGHQEILVANAVKSGAITKPIIAWCMGTSNEFFGGNVQFGHAGASANSEFESAVFKNSYMKECGILIPDTFEGLQNLLKITYQFHIK
jgi:ATP citrate (pro-S)-lyase